MKINMNFDSPENKKEKSEDETKLLQERILDCFANPETQIQIENDFTHIFEQLGLSQEKSIEIYKDVSSFLKSNQSLRETEDKVRKLFQNTRLNFGNQELNLIEVLNEKLKNRAETIFKQVAPYLKNIRGKVIDYGAGDGQITQLLSDQLLLNIEGVDIRSYHREGLTVPIYIFDGTRVEVMDKHYEAGLLTNVLHHEQENEKILAELDRIIKHKLVIIETIPEGKTEEEIEMDKDRTFMNDYLYNRLFHNANIPVPGAYETPKDWIRRISKYGWKLNYEEDLGVDQPVIKDRHYLLEFQR